jgi:hypothetical protein
MLTLLSAVVALGCVLAAARRLVWAVAPTVLDPTAFLDAVGRSPGSWRGLHERVGTQPDLQWERDLLAAWHEPVGALREAVADEQLFELRWRVQRWERVPRVCASIATSGGFLFATIVLLQGLAAPVEPGAPISHTMLLGALTPFSLGLAGMAFCVAVHLRARRIVSMRLAAYDRLLQAARGGRDEESASLA